MQSSIKVIASAILICAGGAAAAQSPSPATEDAFITEVRARDDELAAAHGRGDLDTYRKGLSKHYAYIDIGGKRVTADTLTERRESDQRRVVSSEPSEFEALRVSDDTVLLRGVDYTVATYYGGLPRRGSSRWSALWAREADGVVRLVAETATPIRDIDSLPFTEVPQSKSVLDQCVGDWTLATTPPLTLHLKPDDGGLIGQVAGNAVTWNFRPTSAVHYVAKQRPFELRCTDEGRALVFVSWGIDSAGTRVARK